MIEKMKFVNIMGPVDDIDRVRECYISKYDIQIEDAVKEIAPSQSVTFLSSDNPLVEILKDANHHAYLANVDDTLGSTMTKDEAVNVVTEVNDLLMDTKVKKEELIAKRKHYEGLLQQITPFIELEFPIETLLKFDFIKYRFGRIPLASYSQFNMLLSNHPNLIFQESYSDKEYVYGIYFVPRTLHEKVDMIFASLHFERIKISAELHGTPETAFNSMKNSIDEIDKDILAIESQESERLQQKKTQISAALRTLKEFSVYYDMKKYIAKTKDGFYIIVGWMTAKEAKHLEKDTEGDAKVVVIIEDNSPDIGSKAPTKLKNFILFRPFEFFVKMYGLPAYNEFDPTPFFAITYSILFGIMFGDLGQGLVIALIGLFIYVRKKAPLGAILGIVGLSSAIFGLLYGSVFGYEEILKPIWMRPMDNMNEILITTVAFGIFLNMCAMVIQTYNAIKAKDFGSVIFSSNGLSGIVFYVFIIISILMFIMGKPLASAGIIAVFVGIPILCIAFKEPLTNLLEGKKKLIHGKFGLFIMEALFETFEVMLSFVTNTISFVRVGAFALCHAGMMSVVLMLAGAREDGGGNVIVMIVGNLFVMGMEGLVVAIQVLRLQYYEMFSRFFKGGGKEFTSYKKHKSI